MKGAAAGIDPPVAYYSSIYQKQRIDVKNKFALNITKEASESYLKSADKVFTDKVFSSSHTMSEHSDEDEDVDADDIDMKQVH